MSKFVAKQPNIEVKTPIITWSLLDEHRLILARYKCDGKATSLIKVQSGHFIMIGTRDNGSDVIERVTGMDWLLMNLDFIRYYAEDDKLVLSGS